MHVCMCACSGREDPMEVTLHSDAAVQGLALSSEQGSYARQWDPGLLALCASAYIMDTAQEKTQRLRGSAAYSASPCGLRGR